MNTDKHGSETAKHAPGPWIVGKGKHPNSLEWEKPMTSDQAMRYWNTNGLIAAELYEADLRRLRHTIAQLRAELTHAYEALNQARQESFYVREYLDEARSWIRAIHDEVAASPQTREEWRDGLCRGSVAAALSMCKHALGEIPEGGEVVFRVRQKLASSARGEAKGEA